MKLYSFKVEHFKSIVDTGVCRLSENDNILVLAGQNEAGKSAVIEALDFFGNGASANFEKLHRRQEQDPVVTAEFILDKSDIDEIQERGGSKELIDYLIQNPKIGLMRCISTDEEFELFLSNEMEASLSEAEKNEMCDFFDEETPASPTTPTVPVDPTTQPVPESVPTPPPSTEKERFTKSDFEKVICERMQKFIFYSTFDSFLPGILTIDEIEESPAVLDFQKVFNVDFSEIASKDDRHISRHEQEIKRKASDDLNKYWTQKLEANSSYNFSVKITRLVPVGSSTVQFMIDKDDSDPLYLEQKSQGFRWFSSFNLRLRALGVEEDTIKNLVIMIDEPGQGLHEKAQKDLKRVIEELGEKGAQIMYTTHYPNLIGTNGKEFSRIRLVSNTNDSGTKVDTVAQFASRDGNGASDALTPIVTAMGMNSIGSLMDQKRKTVLVEGITDHYYLSALEKILNIKESYSFVPSCGVSNIPNIASILLGWGLRFKAVFDDDPGSGRKAYNLLKKEFYEGDDAIAHEHILKIKGCNGIEDIFSKADFYKYVLEEQDTSKIDTTKTNSELAKDRKEVLARLFLERSETISISLDKDTTKKVKEVFDWLTQKFK